MPYTKTPSIKKRVLTNKFLIFLKNSQKAIYVILLVSVIAVGGYISRNKKGAPAPLQTANPVVEEKKVEKKPETYSRVTFFFTQPIKGSLAMPESWEGKYRMSDNGNTVNFAYIGNPEMMAGLFSVSIFKKEDWTSQNPQQGAKIVEQEGYVFVYKKAEDNPYKGEASEKYLKMLERSDEIIQSFKGFKL